MVSFLASPCGSVRCLFSVLSVFVHFSFTVYSLLCYGEGWPNFFLMIASYLDMSPDKKATLIALVSMLAISLPEKLKLVLLPEKA